MMGLTRLLTGLTRDRSRLPRLSQLGRRLPRLPRLVWHLCRLPRLIRLAELIGLTGLAWPLPRHLSGLSGLPRLGGRLCRLPRFSRLSKRRWRLAGSAS